MMTRVIDDETVHHDNDTVHHDNDTVHHDNDNVHHDNDTVHHDNDTVHFYIMSIFSSCWLFSHSRTARIFLRTGLVCWFGCIVLYCNNDTCHHNSAV
jgi:hypothetical protein